MRDQEYLNNMNMNSTIVYWCYILGYVSSEKVIMWSDYQINNNIINNELIEISMKQDILGNLLKLKEKEAQSVDEIFFLYIIMFFQMILDLGDVLRKKWLLLLTMDCLRLRHMGTSFVV